MQTEKGEAFEYSVHLTSELVPASALHVRIKYGNSAFGNCANRPRLLRWWAHLLFAQTRPFKLQTLWNLKIHCNPCTQSSPSPELDRATCWTYERPSLALLRHPPDNYSKICSEVRLLISITNMRTKMSRYKKTDCAYSRRIYVSTHITTWSVRKRKLWYDKLVTPEYKLLAIEVNYRVTWNRK